MSSCLIARKNMAKKHADKIVDFNLNNDLIVFGNGRFKGMSDDPQFISVERKKNFKSAIKSDVEFVYWSKRGRYTLILTVKSPALAMEVYSPYSLVLLIYQSCRLDRLIR